MSKNRVLVEEQFTWYETNLPLLERKKRGHFSTPPLLVEKILDACGYTPDNDLTHVRVLDPACGSGNFLIEAARRLQAFSITSWSISQEKRSCFSSVTCGVLIQIPSLVSWPRCTCRPSYIQALHTLSHLHLYIFTRPIAWYYPGNRAVDLFIANPPYLAAKNNDLSGYHFAQQRGQADSYLLFLNLALQVVRPGGWIGLVLPDPLLARANAARERARLLEETTILPSLAFFGCICSGGGRGCHYCQKISTKKHAFHFMDIEGAGTLLSSLDCTTRGATITV